MGKIAIAAGLVVAWGSAARAQSINVSFGGNGTDGPAASYAAAGMAGTWNSISGVSGTTFQLVGLDGAPSGVSVSQGPTTTTITATDASVSGDDAALLDHGLITTGSETCLSFSGFTPGQYEVLVYAWVPNQPAVLSRTRQDQAPATKDIGGAWPGHHAEGVTYARYVVTVDSSGSLPAHSGLATNMPSAALNGVQIRPLTSGGAPDAGTGGGPGGGPIGDDAGTTANPHHHGGCNAGGGSGSALVLIALLGLRRRRPS